MVQTWAPRGLRSLGSVMQVVGHLAHEYQLAVAVMENQLNKEGPIFMTAGENFIQQQVGGTVTTSAGAVLDHPEPRQNLQRKVVMGELHHLVTLTLEVALSQENKKERSVDLVTAPLTTLQGSVVRA